MKMPVLLLAALALLVAGCAPVSISQASFARPLFNDTTVGGAGYPLVVEGAESIGMDPVLVAQNMRFPARLGAGGSFRAVPRGRAPATHAHIYIQPGQPLAPSTLTFVHGTKRIGSGTFSIAPAAYRDPNALGAVSATLIDDLLRKSARNRCDDSFLFHPRSCF